VFGESPFKAEVYFVNQKVFLNIKWGTRDPIAYRDKELSLVRLRAHGEMAIRISDPVTFVNKVVGTKGIYATKDIEGFLKSLVVSALAQTVGTVLETIFDLAVRYAELSTATKVRVADEFAALGTELVDFVIGSITPPEEVQTRIDERGGMAAIGDMETYLRYKSAIALGEAATNPRGGAGVFKHMGPTQMTVVQQSAFCDCGNPVQVQCGLCQKGICGACEGHHLPSTHQTICGNPNCGKAPTTTCPCCGEAGCDACLHIGKQDSPLALVNSSPPEGNDLDGYIMLGRSHGALSCPSR